MSNLDKLKQHPFVKSVETVTGSRKVYVTPNRTLYRQRYVWQGDHCRRFENVKDAVTALAPYHDDEVQFKAYVQKLDDEVKAQEAERAKQGRGERYVTVTDTANDVIPTFAFGTESSFDWSKAGIEPLIPIRIKDIVKFELDAEKINAWRDTSIESLKLEIERIKSNIARLESLSVQDVLKDFAETKITVSNYYETGEWKNTEVK